MGGHRFVSSSHKFEHPMSTRHTASVFRWQASPAPQGAPQAQQVFQAAWWQLAQVVLQGAPCLASGFLEIPPELHEKWKFG